MIGPMRLAIDPGQKGALAWSDGEEWGFWSIRAEPRVGVDHLALARQIERVSPERVYLERAQAMPGQGVSSVFVYGRDYGAILGICAYARLPVETVPPAVWHRELGIQRSGDPKAATFQFVQARLPSLTLPETKAAREGVVDALAILLWAQQRREAATARV